MWQNSFELKYFEIFSYQNLMRAISLDQFITERAVNQIDFSTFFFLSYDGRNITDCICRHSEALTNLLTAVDAINRGTL